KTRATLRNAPEWQQWNWRDVIEIAATPSSCAARSRAGGRGRRSPSGIARTTTVRAYTPEYRWADGRSERFADMREFETMNNIYASYFPPNKRPARTCIGVTGLAKGARVEIDFIARRPY